MKYDVEYPYFPQYQNFGFESNPSLAPVRTSSHIALKIWGIFLLLLGIILVGIAIAGFYNHDPVLPLVIGAILPSFISFSTGFLILAASCHK